MEYFKREVGGYVTTIDPIKNYLKQAIQFVSTYKDVSQEDAKKIVTDLISKVKTKNPLVTYRARLDNGDREFTKCSLTNYIKETVASGDVIVPSFTVYDHPSKKKSLHSDFLQINISKRKKHKALAFEAYQNKDMAAYTSNDVLQKVMKIFNNSLSGAYASKSTALYNPSQHYTLTSMTRCVASIGNAVTESVVAGNKSFYTPEAVIDYITAVITVVNINQISAAMVRHNIVYPTPDNVMEMLCYSSDRYWTNTAKKEQIMKYILTLNKEQLAAVMYVNDLYHLKKYNNQLVREFIGTMATKVHNSQIQPLAVLNKDLEGINNLVHHICMEELRGKKVKYSELVKTDPKLLMLLGATAENIYITLNKYRLLLKAFFITDVLPIDIANIRECYRDVIVLSDTDSTCGSYDKWTDWYFGHTKCTPEAIALSAAVMTINTQVMDHNIKVFAKNMNIEDNDVDLLKMKNEFLFTTFVTANVSKHYYANTSIQEGNVYDKPKLELKGVHLIASAGNQDIVAEAHSDMQKVIKTVENGGKISVKAVLKKVINMEKNILTAIDTGITMFKLDKIKDPEAYKIEDKSKTPYLHHLLWTEVFADTYGNPGDPTYMTVKVATTLKSKRTLAEFLENIADPVIKEKLTSFLAKHGKEALGTFRVPLSIAHSRGIPKEMLGGVDKYRVVCDNMNIYYIFLESIGIFRKPKILFSEMGIKI